MLKCRRQDIQLVVVYSIPERVADDFIQSKLEFWCNKGKSPVVGVFNAPYINWVNLEVESSISSFNSKLLETSIGLALFQHIRNPTRYDLRNSSSLLDLVFTHGDDVGQMTLLLPLGRSDHAVILLKFMAEVACQTVAPARPNILKADIKAINSAASAKTWEIDSRASVQEAWTLFRQLYNRVTQPYIPWTVPKKKKHGNPWIGRDIRRLLGQKRNVGMLASTLAQQVRWNATDR
ncbi:unnamed protein product [Schistosoma curassoni]|nr:unnamed protein product [Schistosoma curassoni]